MFKAITMCVCGGRGGVLSIQIGIPVYLVVNIHFGYEPEVGLSEEKGMQVRHVVRFSSGCRISLSCLRATCSCCAILFLMPQLKL